MAQSAAATVKAPLNPCAVGEDPHVALDGRQRDVDHGRIQNHHELRDSDDRQHGVRVDT
jgi:hypothetical protein